MTIRALGARLMGLTPVLEPVGGTLWDSLNDSWRRADGCEDEAKRLSFCLFPHFSRTITDR